VTKLLEDAGTYTLRACWQSRAANQTSHNQASSRPHFELYLNMYGPYMLYNGCGACCVCCRAVYPKGVGAPGLARYLQEANKEVEVWLQVGTRWPNLP